MPPPNKIAPHLHPPSIIIPNCMPEKLRIKKSSNQRAKLGRDWIHVP